MMSALTRGVAVAVSAMKGTPKNYNGQSYVRCVTKSFTTFKMDHALEFYTPDSKSDDT